MIIPSVVTTVIEL